MQFFIFIMKIDLGSRFLHAPTGRVGEVLEISLVFNAVHALDTEKETYLTFDEDKELLGELIQVCDLKKLSYVHSICQICLTAMDEEEEETICDTCKAKLYKMVAR